MTEPRANDKVNDLNTKLFALNSAKDRLLLIKDRQEVPQDQRQRIETSVADIDKRAEKLRKQLESEQKKKFQEDIDEILGGIENIDTDV